MNIKYWVLVGILALGVVFLAMDNCGNAKRYQKLKGEYEVYRIMAKQAIQESILVIGVQDKKIKEMDEKIEWLNEIIAIKDEDLADIEEDLGELQRKFKSLQECQAQYDKLVEGFNLCKSINADKDKVIFNLQEKYEAQVQISLEYKAMYESEHTLRLSAEKVEKACGKSLKNLQFLSRVKTGIVITMAGIILYNLVK